jgi:cytochrome c-type biogenesis protein CcmH/NrfG
MELGSPLADNLRGAIASATRLQGHRVHKDTVAFWTELLNHARLVRRRARIADMTEVEQLIAELETCVQAHASD